MISKEVIEWIIIIGVIVVLTLVVYGQQLKLSIIRKKNLGMINALERIHLYTKDICHNCGASRQSCDDCLTEVRLDFIDDEIKKGRLPSKLC